MDNDLGCLMYEYWIPASLVLAIALANTKQKRKIGLDFPSQL